MKASDELFQLIKSLDSSEKRYFKMFSELQSGGKNYVVLFDAIDQQESYDEEKLKQSLKGESFVSRIAIEKVLLYKHILKCLDIYNSNSSEFKIQNQLRHVKILMNKGLYKQSEKMLVRIKSEAEEQEDFSGLAAIHKLELTHIHLKGYAHIEPKDLDDLNAKVQAALSKEKNLFEYRILLSKMSYLSFKQGFNRSADQTNHLEVVKEHPLLKEEKNALSMRALYYYYQCQTEYFLEKEDSKGLVYYKKIVPLAEKLLDLGFKEAYIFSLGTLLHALIRLKKYDETPMYLKKLHEVPEKIKDISEKQKNLAAFYASHIELELQKEMGDFKSVAKQEEIFTKIYSGIRKRQQMHSDFSLAYAYFGQREYGISQKYLNRILEKSGGNLQMDILSMAKVLLLLVYFEKDDRDLLEYAVKSTYRFLYKMQRVYTFETVLLDFIRKKLPKIKTEMELTESFKSLREELIALFKDRYEAKVLYYFDFISWLDSKIKNKSFAEIMREKAKAYNK